MWIFVFNDLILNVYGSKLQNIHQHTPQKKRLVFYAYSFVCLVHDNKKVSNMCHYASQISALSLPELHPYEFVTTKPNTLLLSPHFKLVSSTQSFEWSIHALLNQAINLLNWALLNLLNRALNLSNQIHALLNQAVNLLNWALNLSNQPLNQVLPPATKQKLPRDFPATMSTLLQYLGRAPTRNGCGLGLERADMERQPFLTDINARSPWMSCLCTFVHIWILLLHIHTKMRLWWLLLWSVIKPTNQPDVLIHIPIFAEHTTIFHFYSRIERLELWRAK